MAQSVRIKETNDAFMDDTYKGTNDLLLEHHTD
jgi:hypothetical protein